MRLKSLYHVFLIAVVVSVGAMALTPSQAMAEKRPYRAAIEALAVGFPSGVYDATGIATHLGKIIEFGTYEVVGPAGPGLFFLAGEGTQIAANGDALYFTFDEIVDFNVEPFTAEGTFTITGGTGRFEDATGGGTFNTVGQFLDEGLGLMIHYDGTIDY